MKVSAEHRQRGIVAQRYRYPCEKYPGGDHQNRQYTNPRTCESPPGLRLRSRDVSAESTVIDTTTHVPDISIGNIKHSRTSVGVGPKPSYVGTINVIVVITEMIAIITTTAIRLQFSY